MTATKPFAYYGGKDKLVPEIKKLVPLNIDLYCEPFAGSAALFFAADYRWARVEVLNDIDRNLITFFRVLRDPGKFDVLVRALSFMPHSREELKTAVYKQKGDDYEDDIDRALYFFVQVEQSWVKNSVSFQPAEKRTDKAAEWAMKTNRARLLQASKRLRQATIENHPFSKIFGLYDSPDSFFYLDPPYLEVASDRATKRGYRGNAMTDEDHRELIDLCLSSKGKILLSGYDNEIYSPALAPYGWKCITKRSFSTGFQRRGNGHHNRERTEVLWFSPSLQAKQLTLF